MGKNITLNSAINMMRPRYGGYIDALMAINAAIRNGSISPTEISKSPAHNNKKWSSKNTIDRDWFKSDNHSQWDLFYTLTEETLKEEWKDFIFQGGILFNSSEINSLKELLHIKDDKLIVREQFLRAKNFWNLPQVIAWVASGSFALVSDDKLVAPWEDYGNGKRSRTHWMRSEANRRRSIGWLVEIVSRDFCYCGKKAVIDKEEWENCECISVSLDLILAAIRTQNISAFDERCNQSITRNSISSFRYNQENFTLKGPSEKLRVMFNYKEILREFPEGPISGRPRTVEEVRNWISKFEGDNYKNAWSEFTVKFGDNAYKKSQFVDEWRELHGHRGRGRLKNK